MYRFRDDPITFARDLEREHGAVARIKMAHKTFHFMFDADLAEHVLLKNNSIYKKSRIIFDKIIPITGRQGLVQLEDDEWALWRTRSDELFTKSAFITYADIIDRYLTKTSSEIMKAWAQGRRVDISSLFVSYAIRSAVRIFLGCHDPQMASDIAHDFIELNHRCGLRMRNFFNAPLSIKTSANRALTQLTARLRAQIRTLAREAWAGALPASLISHLAANMRLRTENDLEILTDQLMTFLFAGFETTSSSLAFCFYLLAKHPQAQQRIREEARINNCSGLLSLDDIKQYRYTMAVYKEALRLYPPAWILAREAAHDDVIGSHRIQKQDNVIVCIRQIHRSSTLWSNPDAYNPERFLQSSPLKKRCAFIPFGVGPRICSGHQLAMLEGVNAIVRLCRQFEFFTDEDELQLKAVVTLTSKEPIILKVKPL